MVTGKYIKTVAEVLSKVPSEGTRLYGADRRDEYGKVTYRAQRNGDLVKMWHYDTLIAVIDSRENDLIFYGGSTVSDRDAINTMILHYKITNVHGKPVNPYITYVKGEGLKLATGLCW